MAENNEKLETTGSAERTRTISWQDPRLGAEKSRTMSGLEYIRAMMNGDVPPAPIGILMNFKVVEVEKGRVVFACEPAEYHYNPIGVVHGGLAATMLDSALGCAVHTALPAGMAYTTLELHVNYVRAMTSQSGEVRCEAEVLHVGRQMATAQAKLVGKDGKLYGHGTTTCLVFPVPLPQP